MSSINALDHPPPPTKTIGGRGQIPREKHGFWQSRSAIWRKGVNGVAIEVHLNPRRGICKPEAKTGCFAPASFTHSHTDSSGGVLSTSLLPQQLPKHVVQNTAVLVVEDLLRRVDADGDLEFADAAVWAFGANGELPALTKVIRKRGGEVVDVVGLLARQS